MRIFIIVLALALAAGHARAAECAGPEPVCAFKARVFRVASFDPAASAVLIEPGLLVTNRHVVADNPRAEVFRADGTRLLAEVLPTSYRGDLVLLAVAGLTPPSPIKLAGPTDSGELFTVANDIGRGQIRVYAPGTILAPPLPDKPLSRLHHTAISRPGNSGGALVNRLGKLVGIVTSGGEGRFEAIPAAEIGKLKRLSGPDHDDVSRRTGRAYRECAEALDSADANRSAPSNRQLNQIRDHCPVTENRQLFDLAGRILGQRRLLDDAVWFLSKSLDQDPNAINARIAMAVTLHIAGRYAEEIPHIQRLLKIVPSDLQVLRFAVQAGAWGGDALLAERGVALMKKHHPKLAPLAERFLAEPPPKPRRN